MSSLQTCSQGHAARHTHPQMAESEHMVAEMQGLYGPYAVHERVVQKIWMQRDFYSAGATLCDGASVEVLSPGKWNLLGGPDFKQAHLRISGCELRGDVEVHFHARDWDAHGHTADPAYGDVILHVVLFPQIEESRVTRRADGSPIPTLVLLPLLHRDLEDYAADDALEVLTARDDWRQVAELAALPLTELRSELSRLAAKRWSAKVASARLRVEKLGWEGAAHHTALEILGYRQNRVPMLIAAERWPLYEWCAADVAERVFSEVGGWRIQGVRPANHPAKRLVQYASWVRMVPDWPRRLEEWADNFARANSLPFPETTRQVRRMGNFRQQTELLSRDVIGDAVAGSRLHTLICDGFLPMLGATKGGALWQHTWMHWFPGDIPEAVGRHLKALQIVESPACPLAHGWAQGLLAWLIQRENRA